MRLGGEIRVVDDAEERALHPRFGKGAQQVHRIATAAATRIVGDIGEGERRQRRVACDCQRLLHRLVERGQLWIKAGALLPAKLRDLARQ